MKKAYLYAIAATCLGGSSGVFIKSLPNLSPIIITFFRFSIPTILIGIFLIYKRIQPFHKQYILMFLASCIGALRIFLMIWGITLISMGVAHTLFFIFPIFVSILGIIFLKERITKLTVFLLLTAFSGVLIIYSQNGFALETNNILCLYILLSSAMLHAIFVIIIKYTMNIYSRLEIVFHQSLIGAILLLPFLILNIKPISIAEYSIGISYGVIIGLFTWLLHYTGLKYMKVSHWSILTYIEVPAAIIFGFIFFQEPITIQMVIGALFIIGSETGLILTKYKKQKNNI